MNVTGIDVKTILLPLVGLVLFGFGAYGQFFASPSVTAADQARCQAIVTAQADGNQEVLDNLLPSCTEPGMVAMMDAQASNATAQEAGAAIAAANQADTDNYLLNWFLMGLGFVLILSAAITSRKRV